MRSFLLALAALSAAAQPQPLSSGPNRIEITLERMEGSVWRAIDPGRVLDSGDRVRFKVRFNFDGYLYVTNRGTTGNSSLLFPREETGSENAVQAGKEYLVPATSARFRVAGPPGHDVVYWLVSPMPLGSVPPPRQSKPERPKTLIPRCDDAIFRARGECIDSSAGLRTAPEEGQLPENLPGANSARSRSLVILRKQEQSVVSSPVPLEGPVVYEFRLAHR